MMNECSESIINNWINNRIDNESESVTTQLKQQYLFITIRSTHLLPSAALIHYYSQHSFIIIRSTPSSLFAALIYYYSQYLFITIRSELITESENSLSTGVLRVKNATTAVNNRVTRV
jgi:hypothetical protein